ncbi:MAG: hypothetical protein NTU89_03210 [Candidatus Dependentiae bacterium]|nr:hypothetical protein [Candidatus Dependentiae bacterium]
MKMQQIGVIFSVAFIGASGEILAPRGQVQDRRVVEVVRSVSPESEREMQRKALDIVDIVGNVSKQMAEFESKKNALRKVIRAEKLRQEANTVLNIVDIVKYAKDKVQEQQSEHVLNIVDVVRFANGSHGDDDRADDVAKAQALVVKVMIDADQSIEKIVSAFENLNSSLPGESKQIEANIIENMISDFNMAIVKHNDFTQAANLEFNGSQDPKLVSLKQDLYEKIQNNVHKMFLMIQAAQSNQAEAKEANGQRSV